MRRAIPFTALILLAAFVLSGFSSQEVVVGRRRATSSPAIALVAHGFKTGSGATSALNMTGATLLVACVEGQNSPTAPTDSSSNIWQTASAAGASYVAQLIAVQVYYVYNPTVTSSQTFTNTYANSSMTVAGFSGTLTTSGVYDTGTGNGSAGVHSTTIQPGSITVTAGELLFSCAYSSGSGGWSVDSSFVPLDSPTPFGQSAEDAYLVAGAGAVNPTWTTTLAYLVAAQAAFKHP